MAVEACIGNAWGQALLSRSRNPSTHVSHTPACGLAAPIRSNPIACNKVLRLRLREMPVQP